MLRPAITILALLGVLTGVVYPVLVTGIARLAFPAKANGGIITKGGQAKGAELIGQPFSGPEYFWGRPSATAGFPYNAMASGGSNLGPTNPALADAVAARVKALRAADPAASSPIPVDLLTASASGLDPHISPEAAMYQVPRVARARGVQEGQVRGLVARYTEERQFGILGEERVNVLRLNLELDSMGPGTNASGSSACPVPAAWMGLGEGVDVTLARDLKPMVDAKGPGLSPDIERPGLCSGSPTLCPVPSKGNAGRVPLPAWTGLGEGVSETLAHDLAATGRFDRDQKSGPQRR